MSLFNRRPTARHLLEATRSNDLTWEPSSAHSGGFHATYGKWRCWLAQHPGRIQLGITPMHGSAVMEFSHSTDSEEAGFYLSELYLNVATLSRS